MINNNPSTIETSRNTTRSDASKNEIGKTEVARELELDRPVQATSKVNEESDDHLQSQSESMERKIKESLNEVIPKVRELMQKNQRSLDFEVAEAENRVIITVIDKETDEIIRQIPPEEVYQLAHKMGQGLEDALLGVLIDSYA